MHILHIDCSPREASHSRQLSAALVARLLALDPASTVTRRDLGRAPIPHAEEGYATALSSPGARGRHAQHERATRLSEELINEIEAADTLVIGTPMNNFHGAFRAEGVDRPGAAHGADDRQNAHR